MRWLAVFLAACATAPRPVVVAPASYPAQQPASMVTMSREDFDFLARRLIEHNRDKNLAIAGCQEQLTVMTAKDDAANAKVDQLKLATIFGSVGAAVVTAAVALIVHFVSSPAR